MQPHPPTTTAAVNANFTGNTQLRGLVGQRLVATIIFAVCASTLLTAYQLNAAAAGVGTHEQLGLPACALLANTGIPCATCGYTTAFTYAAHGHLVSAFITQPAGALLAIITAMVAIIAGYAMISGASLKPLGQWFWRLPTAWCVVAVLIVSWVYKIIVVSEAWAR